MSRAAVQPGCRAVFDNCVGGSPGKRSPCPTIMKEKCERVPRLLTPSVQSQPALSGL